TWQSPGAALIAKRSRTNGFCSLDYWIIAGSSKEGLMSRNGARTPYRFSTGVIPFSLVCGGIGYLSPPHLAIIGSGLRRETVFFRHGRTPRFPRPTRRISERAIESVGQYWKVTQG